MTAGNEARCHSCGAGDLRHFFEVRDIPVHSVLLMPTREEATSYPTGDLRLGFCDRCGFVQNSLFDASVHEYSTRYEETQGFSARFNRFLEDLAQRLVDRHDIRGKHVLEIGCGKGEFLELLCRVSGSRGTGIDPGYVPTRRPGTEDVDLTFIQDFYGERYADIDADVVCHRHTLEHIQPTLAFSQLVRKHFEGRPDALLFVEIPDVRRVLEEPAFWDIYYEHCSYFSLGTLARLLRRCDFDIVDLWTDFDDQYLFVVARPGDGTNPLLPGEDDLDAMRSAVDRFAAVCDETMARWRADVAQWKAEGKRVVVWGSTSKGVAFLTTLGLTEEDVGYVVDINPHRQGKYMPGSGHQIVGPDAMADYRPDVVIVMNPIYCDEIAADLAARGVTDAKLVPA